MHLLVTATAETASPGHGANVVTTADDQNAGCRLLLEVALEAESGATLGEQLAVHRSVGLVAGAAALTNCLVLENERAHLRCVALPTGITLRGQLGATARNGRPLVRVVAIAAAHLSLGDRVMMWQGKLPALVEMALEAGLRIAARIENVLPSATRLSVEAARTMTAFATDLHRVGPLGLKPRVAGGLEVPDQLCVALRAVLVAHEFRARDGQGRHHRARGGGAGHHRGGPKRACDHDAPSHHRGDPVVGGTSRFLCLLA